jgi:hypothetical protein
MQKFYHLTNCNRILSLGGISFQFSPYEHTGAWMGAYATSDAKEIAALDEAALNPKSSITVLTEAEYGHCIKKKMAASNGYAPSLAASTPTPGVQAAASVGLIDPNPTAPAGDPPVTPLASVGEAIEVVSVQPRLRK